MNWINKLLLLIVFVPTLSIASHLLESQHSLQLGGSVNTGNTNNKNVNAKISSIIQKEQWGYSVSLEGQTATSKGVESARSIKANGKVNYELSDRIYTFAKASSIYDKFATFDLLQREIVGSGYIIKHNATQEFTIEGGPGGVHRRIAGANEIQNQFLLNFAANYIQHLNEHAEFRQTFETDVSQTNTHLESATSVKTTLVKNLALEVSFKVNHDTVIPTGSINRIKTDTATVITMIYSFS